MHMIMTSYRFGHLDSVSFQIPLVPISETVETRTTVMYVTSYVPVPSQGSPESKKAGMRHRTVLAVAY